MHLSRSRLRAKTPLEMLAEELQGGVLPSQVGGLDRGWAAFEELSAFGQVAERRIREAQRSGELSGLSGEGRPLREDRPDLGDPDVLAAKLLKDAQVIPAWMEDFRLLRVDLECFDEAARVGSATETMLQKVNDKVRSLNKSCPPQFQQPLRSLRRGTS